MLQIRSARILGLSCLFFAVILVQGRGAELTFADYDNQSVFNNFSGDSGAFANGDSAISGSFDNHTFHGSSGASLKLRYSVKTGFCGIWNSLLGKETFPQHALNFTNLYGALRNSAGNPSRVEGVRVTHFNFQARGDGNGDFEHALKVEFKSAVGGLVGSAVFKIPNQANWKQFEVPISSFGEADLSQMKELVFVLEDWRNNNRTAGTLFLDDLSFTTDEPASDPSHWGDDALLDVISHRAFSYFLRFTDNLGFALDRSTFSDMVSVGTIGFQLAAYCVGHERGWADKEELEDRVRIILKNLNTLPMGPEPGTSRAGYRGFYYHFLTANSGLRKDQNVELSLYDTMLLMYGVLTCREYFPENAEIQRLSQELFDRVEWDWFVDHRTGPNQYQFFLEWQPGTSSGGTFHRHVDGQTDEAFMVDVLALGSRTHPVAPETCFARRRMFGHYPTASEDPILVSWRGSMFNYFFASCWLNFESRGIDLHPAQPVDVWRNNKLAIEANRQFCIAHSGDEPDEADGYYTTYGENSWGLTACDNLVAPDANAPSEYFSFGALPTEENLRFHTRAPHAGTIAVYGAGSSINFLPKESISALRHFLDIPRLWNPLFGFGDAFSLDPHYVEAPYDTEGNPTIRAAGYLNGPWVNPMTMGVNVGPMLLAIENYRSGLIWNLLAKTPEISTGLDRIFGTATVEPRQVAVEHHSPPVVRIQWNPVPGASAYDVFTSTDMADWRLHTGGIKSTEWIDRQPPANAQRFYLVKAVK